MADIGDLEELRPSQGEIVDTDISELAKKDYLEYALSVVVGRALPDIRDGLKPVHRRVLYAMYQLNNTYNKPYKKSARIVGDVMGKYHPHGDGAIYDTIVRMAQGFSLRYSLIDGQGNFGSVDGDMPAAMRYTEIRLSSLSERLFDDIEKETVDFESNYDATMVMPLVLPTKIPTLLVNGSSGIAVGMATNIAPHNLTEVLDGSIACVKDPDITWQGLHAYIKGPDFPTAGIVSGSDGIKSSYETGHGKFVIRARAHFEEVSGGKEAIIITELPYQVNKAVLLESIADLVRQKKVETLSVVRDESDRDGMRIYLELKKAAPAEHTLNLLYSLTRLQITFHMNVVALDKGQPRVLGLKQIISSFISHRRCVITRRTIFELRKLWKRAHILEGLSTALDNIDRVIALIRASNSPAEAKTELMIQAWQSDTVKSLVDQLLILGIELHLDDSDLPVGFEGSKAGLLSDGYHLSERQAQAILDLKLHRLTALEQKKIFAEHASIVEVITDLQQILSDKNRLKQEIIEELEEMKSRFGDKRRTEITDFDNSFVPEDLYPNEPAVVTISKLGYLKVQYLSHYHSQNRGGRGKVAAGTKDDDLIAHVTCGQMHDWLVCLSSFGQFYATKFYSLPQGGRQARGRPIVNILSLDKDESIDAFATTSDLDSDGKDLIVVTHNGRIMRTKLSGFRKAGAKRGLKAIKLTEGDRIVSSLVSSGQEDLLIFSNNGYAARFSGTEVRRIGRGSQGVIAARLDLGAGILTMLLTNEQDVVLVVTESGLGKRTKVSYFRHSKRPSHGVLSSKITKRSGKVVAALVVKEDDEVIIVNSAGVAIRLKVSEIPITGRATQGVQLIKMSPGDKVISVEQVFVNVVSSKEPPKQVEASTPEEAKSEEVLEFDS